MKGKFTLTDLTEKTTLDDMKPYFDVAHNITILIGKTNMTISRLLQLERGDVIELSNSAGESMDILANGALVARGDVTVIDDRFAIRVTELHDSKHEDDET